MTIAAGVILAGGRSSRMHNKALAPLAGQPLIGHVIQRLGPQVDTLFINAPPSAEAFQQFSLPLVADATSGHAGPLAGLYVALEYCQEQGLGEWLLQCPCDAPFLPADLGERLFECASGNQAGLVRYGGILQATFSLWHVAVLPVVRNAVIEEGKGGFKQVLPQIPHAIIDWQATEPPPFFNVNTEAELDLAASLLDPGS